MINKLTHEKWGISKKKVKDPKVSEKLYLDSSSVQNHSERDRKKHIRKKEKSDLATLGQTDTTETQHTVQEIHWVGKILGIKWIVYQLMRKSLDTESPFFLSPTVYGTNAVKFQSMSHFYFSLFT